MAIDLFTLIAQIVNFIILVLLLRHFLFRRIVRVMDEREEAIARRVEEARRSKEAAEKEERSYWDKRRELDVKESELMSRAQGEAEEMKATLFREAREDVDRSQKHWRESLQAQKEAFLRDLRLRTGEQVFETARRVLKDLADEDLERRVVEVFLKRLGSLDGEKKREIKEAFESSKRDVNVVSRFEIPEKLKQKTVKAVKDLTDDEARVRFRTAEGLLGGIELEVRDRKIAWEIEDYLGDLTEKMAEAFEQRISEEEAEEKRVEEGASGQAGDEAG
ncbi:MAG TPA: hypothetical protein ENO03_01940 [Candidatus Aminicenantes bacterium]|nr:hypothetical protein [Candidatus Aminicenantes bacterium]HDT13096.1 hypothetical protein [Candidatus Aminicenantes bacterium]